MKRFPDSSTRMVGWKRGTRSGIGAGRLRAFPYLLVLACAALAQPKETAADTLVTDVTVVDIETGTLAAGQSVLITGKRIAEIGTSLTAPAETVTLDGGGGYLIPGLWDSHVHIFSTSTEPDSALPLYLINGVTGVRDMGALWSIAEQQDLQARIEAAEVVGPRLVLSGAWVDASPGSWPGMFLADTPDTARSVVAQIASEGWAAVKAYSMLDEATYMALAEAADEAGLPLVGHIPERVALRTAIAAGQVGIDHFGRITMACATEEARMLADLQDTMAAGADRDAIFVVMAARNRIVLESWDEALCNLVLADLAKAGTHVSPTLVVAGFYVGDRPANDAPRVRMLPPDVRAAWSGPDFRLEAMTDEVRALAAQTIALDHRTFLMAHRAGVPILASTDASFANPWLFHGFSLLDELDLYVKIGLTPREALYTATVAPPRFFKLPDQDGTIAPGRRADLVLLDRNPLEDLATLRRPRAVIVAGRLLDRQALDQLEAKVLDEGE
jgi:N-acyl-D-aspartate/D-glutamate deacylase